MNNFDATAMQVDVKYKGVTVQNTWPAVAAITALLVLSFLLCGCRRWVDKSAGYMPVGEDKSRGNLEMH